MSLKWYNAGYMGGFLALDVGQESIPAVIRMLMKQDDHLVCGHRGIGHALASGIGMNQIIAELFGRITGASAGKGGAFSFFNPKNNFWGSYAVAGAQSPIAAGLGFYLKMKNKTGVSICCIGDGAVNQGVFHESLNLVSLQNLPVVYVIENNGYAMGMSVNRSSAFRDYLAKRAEAYNMTWDVCEGDEIEPLMEKLFVLTELARHSHRPSILEVKTYRFYGHLVADANAKKYRSVQEIEKYKTHHDPVINWQNKLLAENIISIETVDEIKNAAREEAENAVSWAKLQEEPTTEDILKHVYWECDHNSPASQHGRYFFND